MCGRYSFTKVPAEDRTVRPDGQPETLKARYNIAPTQYNPIIPAHDSSKVHYYRWGLVPHWAKDPAIGYKMINARAESLDQKPAFRNLIARNRCLVLADGFYEWQKRPEGKQPMRICLKDEDRMYFAGLHDLWIGPEGQQIHSYTIITTEPNELMLDIHDRMPVIFSPTAARQWIAPTLPKQEVLRMLLPYPAAEMVAYPVSPRIGKVQNDQPDLIDPYQPPPSLF